MSLEPIKGEVAYEVDTKPVMGLVDALRALEKESASLADSLGGASSAGEKAGKGVEDYGKKTKDAVVATADLQKGAEYLRGALGGLTDLMGQSVQAASEYNTVVSQIATLGPEAAAGTAQWRQEILDVSAAMGQDAVGAANAVYDALSSGVPSDNVISFMETASKAAVAGSTDTSTAVSAISATLNAWKLDASEATQISDTFFAGVNVGVFRFEELASSIGQVAPLAASLGVEYDQVTAATATLTKSGLTASQAITQQRASMISLLTPNTQMVGVLDQLAESNADVKRTAEEQGISIGEAALKTLGYQGTLVAVRDAADQAGVGLAQAMGSSEALGAVLGMTGDNAAGAAADLQLIREAGGSTEAAFETMSQTFDFASKQLSAQLNVAMVEVGTTIGQMLVPMMQRATEILTTLIEGWRGMDEGTRQAIVTIGGLAALIGSGIGIWLSLQAAVAAIGPLLGVATAGMTTFGMAMAATGIGAAVLAIGALVKASHDMNSQLDASYEAVQKAGGGFASYLSATQKAHEQATGLAAVWGVVTQESLRQDLQVKSATEAWMQHSLGVSDAVLSSREYNTALVPLHQEFRAGKISQEEYRAGLVELADATSRAMGEGRILTEAQKQQAEALTASAVAALEKQGATGQAVAQDAEWARVQAELADTVAQGQMSLEQYNVTMQAVTQGRMAQIEADRAAAEAAGIAAGKLREYSAGFTDIIAAGSQWSADEQAMATAVEASWTTLSQGVAQSLGEQYAARQKYHEDMAAAQAADAEAAAAAQQKAVEAEGGHAQKMVELNARLEDAKTEKQRESAEKAIAKENEKLAGILSATESVGGANVEKVKAQYAEQVAAQQEALAQMVVDHVTNMVLMGQTSEETAKMIFATLRQAYPGVEVFSPVADAHVALMATIRDATDESSATQVESIARLPEAMDGAVTGMEEDAARADAVMDTWATGAEVLAQRQGESAATMQANEAALVASGEASTAAVAGQQATAVTAAQNRQAGISEALIAEQASHSQTADEVEAQNQRIRDSSATTTTTIANDSKAIEGAGATLSGGFKMAASEAEQSTGRIKAALSGLGSESTNLAARASAGARAQLEELEGVGQALARQSGAVTTSADVTDKAGTTQAEAHKRAGSAAAESGAQVQQAMDESALSMEEAQGAAEELTAAMEGLPTKIDIPLSMVGAAEALNQVSTLLSDLARLPRTIRINVKADYNPGDPAVEQGGSINLEHWIHDAAAAGESGVNLNSSYDAEGLMEQEGGESKLKLQTALENLNTVLASGDTWAASWQAVWDAFFKAGAEEDGSLAWWLGEMKTGLGIDLTNLPVSKMNKVFNADELADWQKQMGELGDLQARIAAFQTMSLEDQRKEWPRLYEDLKRFEDERHKLQMENMKRLQERMGSHSGIIGAMIDAEKRRHELFLDGMEDENRAVKRQGEDYKEYEKARSEAEKEYERAQRELERALEEAHRARMAAIKEEQKAASEYAKTAHDEVLRLIDLQKDANDRVHEAKLEQIAGLADAEKERHDREMLALNNETAAIKTLMETRERELDGMKLGFDEWMAGRKGEIDGIKLGLSQINSAIRDLPTGRKERKKPEDMVRVKGTAGQMDVVQKALSEGVFASDERLRGLAEIFAGQGELRLDYLREVLLAIQKSFEGREDTFDAETESRKQEIEDAELRWKREKDALELVLGQLDARRTVEGMNHQARMSEINAEKAAEDERFRAENERLDDLKKIEDERHKNRLKAIEEDYALRLMIEEGLSPEEAGRKIAAMRAAVEAARATAQGILDEIAAQQRAQSAPSGGQVPIAPPGAPPPGVPPPGIEPPGRPGETSIPGGQENALKRIIDSIPGGQENSIPGGQENGVIADLLGWTQRGRMQDSIPGGQENSIPGGQENSLRPITDGSAVPGTDAAMTLQEWAGLMNTTARDAAVSGRMFNADITEGARLFRQAAADIAAATGGGGAGDRSLTNYGVISMGDQDTSEFAEAFADYLGL